ncbi:MAG: Flp pilus assembly complex ATPase component TadA [Gammaproteobacteria bacterium]|nr:Flp pilus assembly complex ATPase component TadA [Gammaproteobacteria bacterium]
MVDENDLAATDDSAPKPAPKIDPEQELQLLTRYAAAIGKKVLKSEADLDPTLQPLPEMADWCLQHGSIVVMTGGLILASNPASRDVQSCKSMLVAKGITPKEVLPATSGLISILLQSSMREEGAGEEDLVAMTTSQQQRLRTLVKEAIDVGASDIHLEIRENGTRVRFRKNGELFLHAKWATKAGKEIASVAFNKETDQATAHFNPLVPQDASMPLDIEGHNIRLRLASLPAHGGFDMVMRILSTGTEGIPTLEQLGYTKEQVFIITRATKMPHGAVLVAGPTGSGKTTTLASCLNLIETQRKMYTIEDPVEKLIPNATQVPANVEKEDRNFAAMGRASLRMDPDVVVLGEMRDEDTAAVMVRAAITGHLVFSTIHTNSAPAIVTRLADMKIPRGLLADPNLLVCLMFQRLAAKLCQACAVPIKQSTDPIHQDLMKRWTGLFNGDWNNVKVRGKGCEKCHGTALSGRIVIAEVIWVDQPGREFIQNADTLGWSKYLKEHGWQDYQENAMRVVNEGVCDPLDIEKIIGEISAEFAEQSFVYGKLA